jgi:hypothetical protein
LSIKKQLNMADGNTNMYIGAAIILILLIIWYFGYLGFMGLKGYAKPQDESYTGIGYAHKNPHRVEDTGASSRGATVRNLGTSFSQTNQGVRSTVFVDDVKESTPWAMRRNEGLANNREAPVFTEIGTMRALDSALGMVPSRGVGQSNVARALAEKRVDGNEGLTEGSPASTAEDYYLNRKLHS